MVRVRQAVERLQKYRPPMEGRAGKMRLDFNENTVGCAPAVIRALRKALNSEWLSRYPEYQESRERLARYFGVSKEEILLANGTDDAINLICDAFVEPDDLLVVPAPTFPVYRFFAGVAGARVLEVRYDEKFRLSRQKFLAALRRRPKWVALANPNNPTGTLIPNSDLRAILQAAPHTVVLVDEAYYDFAGETVLPWIGQYPNLIVTRTFSKAFGLAALRLGCIFAHPRLTEAMQRCQNPFPVNSLALACVEEAIRHDDFVKRYAAEVVANRELLCRALERLGVPYVPSAANFVLTRAGENASTIARRLREEGILVRDWSYDPHLRGYLRFTVGSKAQTRKLLAGIARLQHLIIAPPDGTPPWKNFITYSTTGWFA